MVNPFIPTDTARGSSTAVSYDQGLREHMVRVFNYMGIGLGMTGLIAFLVAYIPALSAIFLGSPVRWVAMFAPFGFLLYLNIKLQSMPASRAKTMFWLFCGTMGLSTAAIFAMFTEASIARAFFITAITFSSMALWGYTTKKDLTSMGSFLMMGVLGIVIASLVNLFMQSNMLQWIVSVAGVAIFTGLTAYDTQKIKQTYSASWGAEANSKLAIIGALSLYLDFLNAFQFLLSLTGERR
jgi:FtsH-binding integral membrane protein